MIDTYLPPKNNLCDRSILRRESSLTNWELDFGVHCPQVYRQSRVTLRRMAGIVRGRSVPYSPEVGMLTVILSVTAANGIAEK